MAMFFPFGLRCGASAGIGRWAALALALAAGFEGRAGVEASTNLANPAWTPVGTNTLTGGSSYFSEPEWTNHPARFYRLHSP